MNNVSTQTHTTRDISTQFPQNNINFVIRESSTNFNRFSYFNNQVTQQRSQYLFDCKYNKIMTAYHKKINERGHSILNWRDYDLIHAKIANETIQQLRLNNLEIPYWLISRSKKNTYTI